MPLWFGQANRADRYRSAPPVMAQAF